MGSDLNYLIKNTKFKYGATIIGIIGTSLITFRFLYKKQNYEYNIHKQIGKLISEYEIHDAYDFNNNYKLIKDCDDPWYFDPSHSEVKKGINKLKEKYPSYKIKLFKIDRFPYNRYVVIRNLNNFITIDLDF